MQGYQCDLCKRFVSKPINNREMYNISIADLTEYDFSSFEICKECLEKLQEFIDLNTK